MKQWRVASGKNMNTQGKLKSYKDLLVWQKSMAFSLRMNDSGW